MGLDYHGLAFLRYVRKAGDFGRTATIGRQELHVNPFVLNGIVKVGPGYLHEAYCETLLHDYFGATSVESIDNSGFEHATHILDMNAPLAPDLREQYDTVLDIGTLEHVYDIVQALKNTSALCRPGGQIVHVLPANNFCGHGFWQFSPELFFSLYSTANGYRDTEVYIADFTDKRRWYQVAAPTDGKRVNIFSCSALYVMVRTVRADAEYSHAQVQQSDYAFEWANTVHDPQPHVVPGGLRGMVIRSPLYDPLFRLYQRLAGARSVERLSPRTPGLRAVAVAERIA